MNGESQHRKVFRPRCPTWGSRPYIPEDDTIIVMQPWPALQWPCPDCDDVHNWWLNEDGFDLLFDNGFDIASAMSDDGPIFVAQKQSL